MRLSRAFKTWLMAAGGIVRPGSRAVPADRLMSLVFSFIVVTFLINSANSCHPQFEKELRYLDHYLGLRPIDEGVVPSKESSQFASYITRQEQLNCDLGDECYWKNAASDGLLDTSQWWLFEKADATKSFPYQIAPGASRLAQGTRLLIAGNTTNTAESAVLITAPIACQRGISNLTFNYWLYNQAKIEVIIAKAMNRRKHIQTILRPKMNCHFYRPSHDKCRVIIPEISEPFRIAIRAFNLKDTVVGSMAMINNISYIGDLCGDSPFPNYFTSVALPPPSHKTIKSLSEMECQRPRHKCGWSNAESSQSEWRVARSADGWAKIFPSGDATAPKSAFIFLAVDGLSPRPFATLRSAVIPCTQTTTTLSMRYWLKPGTQVEVCAVDDDSIPLSCVYLTEEDSGNNIEIDVDAFRKPFRFTIEMINFESTGMGFIAVADLKLSGLLCSEQPPPIVTTIDPPTIVSLFGLQRGPGAQAPYSLELSCDFTQDYCSQWVNDDGNVAYGVTPRDTRKFPIPNELKGNVALFMLTAGQKSILRSRQVPCSYDATLTVVFFRSQHAVFRLCALENCVDGKENYGQVTIPISSADPFEVQIEAAANAPGVVIVKEIRAEGNVCPLRTVEQLVCHKIQCSFQDDLCQYQTVVEREDDAVLIPGQKGLTATLTTEKKRAVLRSDDFDLPSASLLVISITQTTFGSRVLICPDVTSLAELCHEVLGPRVVSAEPRRVAFPLDSRARRFALVLEHEHAEQFGPAVFEIHAIDIRTENDHQLCF